MNVNATLFVQVVHFFIAYLLFRFILLKPAYQAIVQEDQYKAEFEALVVADKQSVEEKKQEQQKQWLVCQKHCKKHIPQLPDEASLFRGIVPRVSVSSISTQELRDMRKRVSQTIISLVEGAGDRA